MITIISTLRTQFAKLHHANSRLCIALFACAALAGCGGGGSSSGGGGGGGSDSASGVRVLHASIDAVPVDLLSSSRTGAVSSKVVFADQRGYRPLSAGDQTITITRALDAAAVVSSFTVSSSGDDAYSVLLYGSLTGSGLRSVLIQDTPPSDSSGTFVRFVHGADGAAALLVNVSGSTGAQRVAFGQASDYIPAGPGEVRITANRAADGRTLVSMTETLEEGRSYTVLVAGETGYYTKGVLFRD